MDRKIDNKTWTGTRRLAAAAAAVLVLVALYGLVTHLSVPRMTVDPDRLLIATVERGTSEHGSSEHGSSEHGSSEHGSSEHGPAVLLPKGAFFQATGGHWVFVVNEAAGAAVRRPVRLGARSDDHYEVLSGLEPGERVITSSYDHFGDAEQLVLEP